MLTVKNEIKKKVLQYCYERDDVDDAELLEIIDKFITEISRDKYYGIKDRQFLRKEVFNSLRRLDLLQELIDDKSITEIMVNGIYDIFIERKGRLSRYDRVFESQERLEDVVQQIVASCNRRINEAHPIVDARLQDGSRVNIVIPPVALEGPIITIRKFPDEIMSMEKLIELGSITEEVRGFLSNLVIAGYNIFVSGGTGSGKTTFLNALSGCIPETERVITIEDSAELQLNGLKNLVRLEVRNANSEGNNSITIRDLIKTSLRMRPDRIIVGEVRDAACVDMLQALNTGHCGMSTGHANSTKDLLSRLETLVLLGTEIPLLAVRKQIASAIDIIVHLGRLRDKSRRVLEISEIVDCRDGDIQTNCLYTFRETGEDEQGNIRGALTGTGNSLIKTYKLLAAGINEIKLAGGAADA